MPKPITPFGWMVKKRLAELKLDQKQFCEKYNIPQSRLSNIIHGTRKASHYQRKIAEILSIPPEDEHVGPSAENRPDPQGDADR